MRDLGVGHHGDQLPLHLHQHVPCLQAGLVRRGVNSKNLLHLDFLFSNICRNMIPAPAYLHNCGNIGPPHNPEAPRFVPFPMYVKIHHLTT